MASRASRRWRTLLLAAASLSGGSGCVVETPWRDSPRVPDRQVAPGSGEQAYCFRPENHIPGAIPVLFGGRCCCLPTTDRLRGYQAQGVLAGWTAEQLADAYRARGATVPASDEASTNDLGPAGPHVVKGGRSLVPPTPGTLNHEEILTGHFALGPWERAQVTRFGGPLAPLPPPPPPTERPDPEESSR